MTQSNVGLLLSNWIVPLMGLNGFRTCPMKESSSTATLSSMWSSKSLLKDSRDLRTFVNVNGFGHYYY